MISIEGKFGNFEKTLLGSGFILILLSTLIRSILGVNDTGETVIIVFVALLVYIIFGVSACFPADWRMTDREKRSIADKEQYQRMYRKVMVSIGFICSVCFGVLILVSC